VACVRLGRYKRIEKVALKEGMMTEAQPAKCDKCDNTSFTLNVTWLAGENYLILCDECQNKEKAEEDRI
jgi:hypothetical protein